MNRHLVPIEVGVVGRAHQGVELDRLALDQNGLKGLDPETMESWRPVQQDWVLPDHLVQNIPDLGPFLFNQLLGAFNGRYISPLFQLVVDKGLEKLEGHLLGEAALMQTKFGSHDDDRAAGVIDSLAEQVLPEAAGLPLEHVA